MTTILEHSGGLEKYLIQTAKNLSNHSDVKIDVITMDDKTTELIVGLLTFYYFKKLDRKSIYQEDSQEIIKELGKARYYKCHSFSELKTKLNQYDVIYSKNELIESFIFKFIIGYKNIPPVIFGCHTPILYPITSSLQSKMHNFLYGGYVYKFLASGVRYFHVVNLDDENSIKHIFPKVPFKKIYNPFDFNKFTKYSSLDKNDIFFDKNKVNIIWIGRLTEQKGVDDLCTIVASVNSSTLRNKIIWNIAGDGEEKKLIVDLAKEWNNVRHLGWIKNRNMANVIRNNNLFINTSKWEGFPYSVLEAQAVGLPVIAYDIGGCSDIIDNNKNGVLVKDRESFVEAIKEFVNGKKNFVDVRKYISTKFDKNMLYEQLIEVFEDVKRI